MCQKSKLANVRFVMQGIESDRNQTIHSRKMKETECAEFDCRNARFGFALASPGDLDGDGYNG